MRLNYRHKIKTQTNCILYEETLAICQYIIDEYAFLAFHKLFRRIYKSSFIIKNVVLLLEKALMLTDLVFLKRQLKAVQQSDLEALVDAVQLENGVV